jgi:hypothetical protein
METLRLWAQCQPALVELGDYFVKALLPKVGDIQKIVVALHEQLADGVDLCTLQAVAWTL